MTNQFSNSGLPLDVIAELVSIYSGAMDRVGKMVRNPWGRTQSSKEFKQARAAILGMQIDAILRQLKGHSTAWAWANLPKAFIDGIQRAQTQAREAAPGIDAPPLSVSASFALIDRKAVEVIARNIVGDLGGAAENAGKQAKALLRATAQHDLSEQQIDRMLASGLIEGKPTQTIRELREAFRSVTDGKVRVIDKNGRPIEFDAGYYASMVARTKTREATVMARHGRLEELGLDLVSIVGRVTPNFCTAYLGQVFSLSGKSDKYPSIKELPDDGPPFHPNCSKSTRPFIEELARGRQLQMAEGLDDSDKMLVKDTSEAQRRFKDLQIYQQQKKRYATTAKELFGAAI